MLGKYSSIKSTNRPTTRRNKGTRRNNHQNGNGNSMRVTFWGSHLLWRNGRILRIWPNLPRSSIYYCFHVSSPFKPDCCTCRRPFLLCRRERIDRPFPTGLQPFWGSVGSCWWPRLVFWCLSWGCTVCSRARNATWIWFCSAWAKKKKMSEVTTFFLKNLRARDHHTSTHRGRYRVYMCSLMDGGGKEKSRKDNISQRLVYTVHRVLSYIKF
jgi:hypothetical protein